MTPFCPGLLCPPWPSHGVAHRAPELHPLQAPPAMASSSARTCFPAVPQAMAAGLGARWEVNGPSVLLPRLLCQESCIWASLIPSPGLRRSSVTRCGQGGASRGEDGAGRPHSSAGGGSRREEAGWLGQARTVIQKLHQGASGCQGTAPESGQLPPRQHLPTACPPDSLPSASTPSHTLVLTETRGGGREPLYFLDVEFILQRERRSSTPPAHGGRAAEAGGGVFLPQKSPNPIRQDFPGLKPGGQRRHSHWRPPSHSHIRQELQLRAQARPPPGLHRLLKDQDTGLACRGG